MREALEEALRTASTAADLEERLRRGEDMANRQLADMERQRDEAEDARRAAVAAAEDLERRLKNGQEMAAKELEAAVNEAAAAAMKLREVEDDARRAAEEGGARIRAHESELEQLRREAAQLREEGAIALGRRRLEQIAPRLNSPRFNDRRTTPRSTAGPRSTSRLPRWSGSTKSWARRARRSARRGPRLTDSAPSWTRCTASGRAPCRRRPPSARRLSASWRRSSGRRRRRR